MYILAWSCVCALFGVWFWPVWEAHPEELSWGMYILIVLVWMGKRSSKWAIYTLFFLLGNHFVARLPEPKAYDGPIIADVQVHICGGLLVYSNKGRFLLQFYGDAPKEGERIAARIASIEEPTTIGSGEDILSCSLRAHAARAKVETWIPFRDSESKYFSSPYQFVSHGGLLWSLMSGDRRFIPKETTELLRRTGTSHFLAISGMHIGFVSLLVFGIVRVFSVPLLWIRWNSLFRIIPYVCSVGVAFLYAEHVGWPASAQRSVCMVVFSAVAMLLGRKIHIWTVLLCAAMLVVYREPAQWDSLGFRLSFCAVGGIVWFSPRIIRLIPMDAHRIWLLFGHSFAVSLGASLGTLPWVGLYFQKFSWIGVISNIFVGPFLGVVAVPCALLANVSSGILCDFALVVGDASIDCAHFLLKKMDFEPLILAFDECDVVWIFLIFLIPRRDFLRIFLLSIFLCLPRCHAQTEVLFLSIGQGDAVLVLWENGAVWLIDGGPPSQRLLTMLRRMHITRIDQMFLSHPHLDHFGGFLPIATELDIGVFWTSRPPLANEEHYQELFDIFMKNEVTIQYPSQKDNTDVVHFIHPLPGWKSKKGDHVNEESLVFDLNINGYKILFTGDVGEEAEMAILQSQRLYDDYDAIKVGHHGSRYSSSQAWVDELKAEDVVISCGQANRFGHPHSETLWKWRKSHIWRTDIQGTIHIQPETGRLWSDNIAKP